MSYSRGDIVLTYFPYADLKRLGKRPALVVQADNLGTGLTHLILAMITSKLFRGAHDCRVTVTSKDATFALTNLAKDSVIMADHLATVEPQLIVKKLGIMADMTHVEDALRKTFDL